MLEEISGRAAEEGSLSQDGQTCTRCYIYRKEQQITVYKTELYMDRICSVLCVCDVIAYSKNLSKEIFFQGPLRGIQVERDLRGKV